MKSHIVEIVNIAISFVLAGFIVLALLLLLAAWVPLHQPLQRERAPTLAECLDSIQQVDDSATSVTEGDGIAYESFICETADYDYVITRDRREVQR